MEALVSLALPPTWLSLAGSLKSTCKPGGPSLKVRVGASSSWHSPGVWSLFSGTLALVSAQGILGLALWLPSFLGLCLMVAVAGGDVMASYLGELPGRWKAGRVQLPSYLSPLTSCSSSELGKGLELL